MVERLRIFRGVEELNYSSCVITKSDDHVIDEGTIEIIANSNVTIGTTLDIKNEDATTTIFTARVIHITKDALWKLKVYANGYELMNIPVQQVYTNMTPEDIVQDIVDTYTLNLTYASTTISGVTLQGNLIANGYAIDIIKQMMELLDWGLSIDNNGNVYFEPKGYVNNGLTFTNGDNFNVSYWEQDNYNQVNHIKIKGGFREVNTQGETLGTTGDPDVFTFANKPKGSLRVTVSGSEVTSDNYTVVAESQEIEFDATPAATPVCDYTYDSPIVVEDQDDASIATYGEIYKEIDAPFLDNFVDARKYAGNILEVSSDPTDKVKGEENGLNFNPQLGESVLVVDPIRDLSETLYIAVIKYDARTGQTEYEFGERDFVFFDWQREVMDRIKKLEQANINEDKVTFARTFKDYMNISLEFNTLTPQFNYPGDSFILGHPTLGRLRTDLNFEADCSNNGHHGTWTGSNIDGDQYQGFVFNSPNWEFDNTLGFRLSAGLFDSNKITVSDTINGITGVLFALNPTTNGGNLIEFSGSAYISLDGTGAISTTGLTSVSTETITSGDWTLYRITFDAVNGTAIEIGDTFDGAMDELFIFTTAPVANDLLLLQSKDFFDSNNDFSFSTDPELYFSFDNPRLGDRSTVRENFS